MYLNRNAICLRPLQKQTLRESIHDLNCAPNTESHSLLTSTPHSLHQVALINSYFFSLLRQKKRQLLSVHSFSLQEPCHTQLSPIYGALPPPSVPQLCGCIILKSSIARAFQDGVRLLRCHVAVTRVHNRFHSPPRRPQTPLSRLKSTPIRG
jgi:hypothetical protein